MQHHGTAEQVRYAGLGWRAAAVIVDTLIVLVASSIVLAILAAAGVVDLGITNAATLNDILNASRVAPSWLMPVEYALIFAYFTLFELRGTTPGKRLFKLSVTADDGTPPSPGAIVVRNVIRIPEMYLLYLPSAVSCLASAKSKRLGDLAGRTVVLRHETVAMTTGAGPRLRRAPLPGPAWQATPTPAAGATAASAAAAPAAEPEPPSLDVAVAALKTAALAVRGAHLNYLRFSEIELAKGVAEAAPSGRSEPSAEPMPSPDADYSPGYASAWYTLTDAVIALQQAHRTAQAAATQAGTTLPEACADQPDLAYLFKELEPYFTAGSDDEVHASYMRVARGETT